MHADILENERRFAGDVTGLACLRIALSARNARPTTCVRLHSPRCDPAFAARHGRRRRHAREMDSASRCQASFWSALPPLVSSNEVSRAHGGADVRDMCLTNVEQNGHGKLLCGVFIFKCTATYQHCQ